MRAAGLLLLATTLLPAADWPRFRGPGASGVADEQPLPTFLSPTENIVWSTELPPGKSSPVLTETRIFLTAHEDDKLFTLGLERQTGRILWRREAPSRRLEKMNQLNDEAASSPVTDGENVYVFFGGYGLLAYSANGDELWRHPMGPFTNFHGMAASPVYADGKVLMICDQDIDAFLIAVDAKTGETAWRVERPEMVHSFSTPTVRERADGRTELIVPGSYQMVGYEVSSGRELWRYRGLTYQVKSAAVTQGDRLYFNGWAPGGEPAVRLVLPPFAEALELHDADGDGRLSKAEVPKDWQPGSWDMQDLDKDGAFDARDWQYYSQRRTSTNATMALRLDGEGDVTTSHIEWRYDKSLPDVPGVLLYRDVLYLIRSGGILTTLDPESGEPFHVGRVRDAIDGYYASPVAGDGKVYLASEKGLVTVLEAGREPEPLGTVDFGEPIYATPAIADGRIYLRASSRLYAFAASK